MSHLDDKMQKGNSIKKLYGRSIESYLIKNIHYYSNSITEGNQIQSDQRQLRDRTPLLPVLSRKKISTLLPSLKQLSLSPRKQPKIPAILHYQSQKLIQFHKAKQEQIHLYKGKKNFDLQVMRMGKQSVEKQERNNRVSMPNIKLDQIRKTKILTIKSKHKQHSQENDTVISKIVNRQLELDFNKNQGRYIQANQSITGWTYGQQENDYFI